jgi:hypothetical protein
VLVSVLLWFITVIALACGRDNSSASENRQVSARQQVMPAPNAVQAPPPSSAAPKPPPPTTRAVSVAIFKSDRLVACVDVSIVADGLFEAMARMDAGMSPNELLADDLSGLVQGADTLIGDYLNQRLKGSSAMMRIPGKPESIPKTCSEQFAGRTILGRCTVAVDLSVADKPTHFALAMNHYNAETSDGPTRACLAGKGNWWELPKDSLDYKREHSKQALDRAMKNIAPSSN